MNERGIREKEGGGKGVTDITSIPEPPASPSTTLPVDAVCRRQ